MRISFYPELKIYSIRNKFQQEYPYLRLEFYRNRAFGERLPCNEIIPDTTSLFDITGFNRETEIEIVQCKTVAEIELAFRTKYNLRIQIFRKSKFDWIETRNTDYLTLEKQNKLGREASGKMYESTVL